MEEEITEEELIEQEAKCNIVWVDGIPCIDLRGIMPPKPRFKFKVIELKRGEKNPFKQLLDEIEKFMGGLPDAD